MPRRLSGWMMRLDGRPGRAAALIFALAFGLRAGILSVLPPSTVFWSEEAEHIALNLSRTGQFANPYGPAATGYTAHTGPFFPALMALLYRLCGTGTAVYYVRSLLIAAGFAAAYALLPWLGHRLRLAPGSGVLAGLAGAVLLPNLSVEVWRAWEEPYVAVALVVMARLTYKLLEERTSLLCALGFGAAWGALFYASASLFLMFVAVLAVFVVAAQGRVWRRLELALLMGLAAAITVAPWVLRDHQRLGAWMFMRSNAGLEIYISNNDQAEPTEWANTQHGPFLSIHPNKNLAQALEVRRLGEVRFNGELMQRARQWAAAHPARFLALTARRAAYFWFPPARVPLHNVLVGLVSLLGLAGWLGMWPAARGAFWTLLPAWSAYPLIYYLVEYSTRYRAPIQALVLLCAGAAVARRMAGHRSRVPASL